MKILVIPNPAILTDLTEEQRERIHRAAGKGSELVVAHTPKEQQEHAPNADVVLGYLSPETFALAQRLQWVQVLSTGADRMLVDKAKGIRGDLIARSDGRYTLGSKASRRPSASSTTLSTVTKIIAPGG